LGIAADVTAEQTVEQGGSPVPGLPAPDNLDGEPTKPVDYGAINVVYLLLLGGLVAATRRVDMDGRRIDRGELVPLGAATFALSKVVAREKIGTWMREPFVEEGQRGRRPRGRRLRHAVGELVTCTRCVGAWSGLGLVSLRVASPETGRLVTSVLAASAVNDFLQAGFRALCEEVNRIASE
jgi:Protein of unknown function (DUF1360)